MRRFMSNQNRVIIIFWITVLTIACNKSKPDPELPPLTHEGKNTFGCYIDNKPFVADVNFTIGGPTSVSGSFDESSKELILQGTREDENEHLDAVRFIVFVDTGVGIYEMYSFGSELQGYIDYSGQNCIYYHDTLNYGTVNITHLDLSNNIISGTFSMSLINSKCNNSTIEVSDGRFDFGY